MKKLVSNFLKDPQTLGFKLIFYMSFYYSSILLYLTLDIIQSPDFDKYYRYFQYFSGSIEKTNLEQGNLYFFLSYLVTFILNQINETISLNEIYNLSIHFTNSMFFLFGCLGLAKYLSIHKYKTKNIYIVLSIICIMPSTIVLRSSFKPEIMAFSIIGWALYFIKLYSIEKNNYSVLRLTILLSILFTSKVSIALMVGFVIFLELLINYKKTISKEIIRPLIVLLIFCSALMIENYQHNRLLIFQTEHDKKYDNVASLEFFSSFDTSNFINNPDKYFYYDSFLGIVLFDSFNDFFGLYSNSEYTELNNSRKQFFSVVKKLDNPIFPLGFVMDKSNFKLTISGDVDGRWKDEKYIEELAMRSSFYFSVIFYLLLFILLIFKKQIRAPLASPFIGLLFLITSSLGVFGIKNFDPLVGDSFKTFYFAYFIILSFSVLFLEILKFNIFKKIFIFSTPMLFLFFLGFPMDYNEQNEIDIVYKNSLLISCNLNGPLINNLLNVDTNIECNSITDYKKKFYPITTVKDMSISLIKIPYLNILYLLILFILNIKPIKLFVINRKLKL